ncbi:MAG: DUF4062 domain-containing protein, partial [Acidobacteriota bacterium]
MMDIKLVVIDLPQHREQARDWRGGAPSFSGTCSPDDAVRASLKLVDEADIYMGIFANRYGYVPDGHEKSISEMEYDRAKERSIPRLIFLMGKDHPIKAADVEVGENAVKVQALKERLQTEQVVKFFDSPADLPADIAGGVPPGTPEPGGGRPSR